MAPFVLACAVVSSTSGCLPTFKNVPLTFAALAEPVAEILPVADAATLVLTYTVAPFDGGKQAVTYVLDDGTAVGQVDPRSFAVARIPAGRHTLVHGIPELHLASCAGVTEDFRAGRIYVVDSGSIVPGSPAMERTLSKLSYLAIDLGAGQKQVQSERTSFWDACVKTSRADEVTSRRVAAAVLKGMGIPPPPTGDLGVTRLSIPAPP